MKNSKVAVIMIVLLVLEWIGYSYLQLELSFTWFMYRKHDDQWSASIEKMILRDNHGEAVGLPISSDSLSA